MLGLRGDRGDMVLSWFVKIVLVLAVVAVIAFEAVSIGVTHVQTQDLAKVAARTGSRVWLETKNVQRAYQAAEAVALEKTGTISPEDFVVSPDGTVTVTIEKDASSLLLFRIAFTQRFTEVRETATNKYVA